MWASKNTYLTSTFGSVSHEYVLSSPLEEVMVLVDPLCGELIDQILVLFRTLFGPHDFLQKYEKVFYPIFWILINLLVVFSTSKTFSFQFCKETIKEVLKDKKKSKNDNLQIDVGPKH